MDHQAAREARFIDTLRKKRETLALGLIENRHSYEKYLEVFARCLELGEVIDLARDTFKGDEDDSADQAGGS